MSLARPHIRPLGVRLAGALLAAGVCLGLAACSGDTSTDPSGFVTQADFTPGVTPPCLVHQTQQPPSTSDGRTGLQPAAQLTFLAYLTAGGNKKFCDGAPATEIDKAWATLYVQLTHNPGKVSGLVP